MLTERDLHAFVDRAALEIGAIDLEQTRFWNLGRHLKALDYQLGRDFDALELPDQMAVWHELIETQRATAQIRQEVLGC